MRKTATSISPKPDLGRLLGGLAFSAVGVSITVFAATGAKTYFGGSRWVVALFGSVFLLAGLWILEAHKLWVSRFPDIDWGTLWGGLLASLVGLLIMTMSGVADDSSFSAPHWVVTLAGAVFLIAGLLVSADCLVPMPCFGDW